MIRWSMGVFLELFPEFLCTFDELFGFFDFVGHYASTPFLDNAGLRFLRAITKSAIHTLHAGVRRVALAGEGCIGREYRGTGCN